MFQFLPFLTACLLVQNVYADGDPCTRGLYKYLASFASDSDTAQSYCADNYPIAATTVTVLEKRHIGIMQHHSATHSSGQWHHSLFPSHSFKPGVHRVAPCTSASTIGSEASPTSTSYPAASSSQMINVQKREMGNRAKSILAQVCTCIGTQETVTVQATSTDSSDTSTPSTTASSDASSSTDPADTDPSDDGSSDTDPSDTTTSDGSDSSTDPSGTDQSDADPSTSTSADASVSTTDSSDSTPTDDATTTTDSADPSSTDTTVSDTNSSDSISTDASASSTDSGDSIPTDTATTTTDSTDSTPTDATVSDTASSDSSSSDNTAASTTSSSVETENKFVSTAVTSTITVSSVSSTTSTPPDVTCSASAKGSVGGGCPNDCYCDQSASNGADDPGVCDDNDGEASACSAENPTCPDGATCIVYSGTYYCVAYAACLPTGSAKMFARDGSMPGFGYGRMEKRAKIKGYSQIDRGHGNGH